jgi:hypothetical protein
MIKRLPIILLLGSCAQFTFEDYTTVIGSTFSKDVYVPISSEYIATKEYSFAKVKIGDNPPAILSLAFIKGNLFTWVSITGQKFVTKHGKIIETYGLEHNIKLLDSNLHALPIARSEQLIQLKNPMAVVSQSIEPITKSNTEIFLDKKYNVVMYVEEFTTNTVKWAGKNYFWIDQDTNLAIKSHQHFHPYEDRIEIEFFYIFK